MCHRLQGSTFSRAVRGEDESAPSVTLALPPAAAEGGSQRQAKGILGKTPCRSEPLVWSLCLKPPPESQRAHGLRGKQPTVPAHPVKEEQQMKDPRSHPAPGAEPRAN